MILRRISPGVFLWCVGVLLVSCSGGEAPTDRPLPSVPAAYVDKHMPQGWWTDPKVVEEGEKIFRGEVNPDVNCSNCHGKDGAPTRRGARDFRAAAVISRFSDSYWFWRVSEGVPMTKMSAWKGKLTEEQRWKVIAYEHTFSHGGQPALHEDYQTPEKPESKS
jgi:mono/diheme cytochrome c family protein